MNLWEYFKKLIEEANKRCTMSFIYHTMAMIYMTFEFWSKREKNRFSFLYFSISINYAITIKKIRNNVDTAASRKIPISLVLIQASQSGMQSKNQYFKSERCRNGFTCPTMGAKLSMILFHHHIPI